MSLPTVDQALEKLAANPAEAAAFDACYQGQGKTRREAVLATLAAMRATIAEADAKRQLLTAKREKIALLEKAKAATPAKPAPRPAAIAKASPKAAAAPKSHLEIFNSLSGPEAATYYQKHRLEILAADGHRKIK